MPQLAGTKMTTKMNQLYLVLLAVVCALGTAAACTPGQPTASNEDAAASSAAREQVLVVVEPVLVTEPGRGTRTEYRPRALRLKPVLKGEAIDYSNPIFAHNNLPD